jgi:uncharacterized protein YbbC (DUF1343 family)
MKNYYKKIIILLVGVGIMTAGNLLEARVYTGIEVFMKYYTNIVRGKRVGLITNPTGVDGQLNSTADIFKRDPRINLVALFAPEHGIRGNVAAGENFRTGRDPNTGLPIYSLYGGKDHRPPAGSLNKVDILIYNIQDVGGRPYTYIWHLAECMSAAAEAGKQVIVLDVPNPLGAKSIDGPIREEKYKSFIALYPVPYVYGMTVGELARMLKGLFKINCRLTVVPMLNYRRGMNWEQTGLPWVPTSPMVPSAQAACCFSITGSIGELGWVDIGTGYNLPFQVVAATWIKAPAMSAALNALRLPGIKFREIHYKPFSGGSKGKSLHGVQIHVLNVDKIKPIKTAVAILCYLQKTYRNYDWPQAARKKFDRAMGTAKVSSMIKRGYDYRKIAATWQAELNRFNRQRQRYLIKEYSK